jgi:ABC-type antimicrobial peptide transport system permease subunit
LDANVPLGDVITQTEQIDQATFQERLLARLSSFYALLALVLACVSLYGMMSYAFARRTNEIGIRMALAAKRARILQMVLGEAMTLAGLRNRHWCARSPGRVVPGCQHAVSLKAD